MCARGLRGLVWDQDKREFESHHPDKNNLVIIKHLHYEINHNRISI